MATIFADGFELGSTLAEANLMSGNVYTLNAQVNAVSSTFTFGNSTMGNTGRSLQMNVISAGSSFSAISAPTSNLMLSTGAIGTQFSMGWKGRLNSSKVAGTQSYLGLSNALTTASLIMVAQTTTPSSAGNAMSLYFGTAQVATFTVADLLPHYYTVSAQKTAANVWSVQVYVDTTRVVNLTGVSAALIDNPLLFLELASGVAAGSNVGLFAELDNMYISDTSSLGLINIRHVAAASDVQAQFTRVGAVGTNYGSVDNITLTTGNSLTATANATDIYGTNSAATAGQRIVAVNATLIANGATSDNLAANASSAGNSITSGPTALGAVDSRISTGWVPLAISGNDLTTLRYGQAKT